PGAPDPAQAPPTRRVRLSPPEEVTSMTDETSPQQQPRPEARTRPTIAQRATSWIAWHAGELAAVGVPSLGAATVHPLLWVLTAGAGAAWGTHEYRQQ